jgi:8-oxo-dGTP diphosphatase
MATKSKKIVPVVRAGVGVIVCNNRRVLVGKRKGPHGKGCWAFPGGHIEPTDKSLKQCGEREVFEETGITCHIYNPDRYRQDLFTTFDILSEDGSKIYVTCYLLAEYISGGKYKPGGPPFDQMVPMEPDKCEGWYWKNLIELADLVGANKTWIPINEVTHYLRKIWRE